MKLSTFLRELLWTEAEASLRKKMKQHYFYPFDEICEGESSALLHSNLLIKKLLYAQLHHRLFV